MNESKNNSIFNFTQAKLIEGIFIRRLNRFVVECLIEGKKQLAHLPNPGRLWELLFKGSRILLYKTNSEDRNLNYTVAAVFKNSEPVLLHTSETNSVAEWLLKNHLIEDLKDFNIISREKTLNNSRIDFHLTNGRQELFLEVKSCTLFHKKLAMFPDAITERGTKHLNELAELNSDDKIGGVLFLVHNKNVEYFLPEFHTDLKFARNFFHLKDKLRFFVYSLDWDNTLSLDPMNIKKVKIPFNVLERELEDSGTYVLVIYNNRKQKIEIGSLGKISFEKGYYCYIGSAMQNLSKRVERHKRKIKNFHWHIDYLLDKTKIHKSIEIRSNEKLECEVASELSKIADGEIKNFGSSDCNCNSHLFYFYQNPLERKDFIELILDFRMGRLIKKYDL
ncbi:MAG: DNA/RNA nuclease SfsA [Ignavibacteria bacterium]